MKSADGADRFWADVKSGRLNQFLLKCLVFTCFEMQNHMRSFYSGSVVKTKIRVFYNELIRLISYKEQGEDIGALP